MGFWLLERPGSHDHARPGRVPGGLGGGRAAWAVRGGGRAAVRVAGAGERSAMLPTVAQVLALDAVRRGQPRVVAAAHRLHTPVRWVHAIEFADAARLLRGGELVLATGIVLPDEDALLDAYVADLAAVGVSALAVQLG